MLDHVVLLLKALQHLFFPACKLLHDAGNLWQLPASPPGSQPASQPNCRPAQRKSAKRRHVQTRPDQTRPDQIRSDQIRPVKAFRATKSAEKNKRLMRQVDTYQNQGEHIITAVLGLLRLKDRSAAETGRGGSRDRKCERRQRSRSRR